MERLILKASPTHVSAIFVPEARLLFTTPAKSEKTEQTVPLATQSMLGSNNTKKLCCFVRASDEGAVRVCICMCVMFHKSHAKKSPMFCYEATAGLFSGMVSCAETLQKMHKIIVLAFRC